MRTVIVFSSCLMVACSTVNSPPVQVSVAVTDNPERNGLEISYTNTSNVGLCLQPGDWPDSQGRIGTDGDAELTIGDKSFYAHDLVSVGYPPGEGIRVAPGQSITAFVRYHSFRLPDELRNAEKKLMLRAVAYRCD